MTGETRFAFFAYDLVAGLAGGLNAVIVASTLWSQRPRDGALLGLVALRLRQERTLLPRRCWIRVGDWYVR